MPFRRSGESRATRKPNKISSAFGRARGRAGWLGRRNPRAFYSRMSGPVQTTAVDAAIPKESMNMVDLSKSLEYTTREDGALPFCSPPRRPLSPCPVALDSQQLQCSFSKHYHVLPSLEPRRRIPRLIFDMGWAGLGRGQGTVGWALLGQGHGRTNSLSAAWAGEQRTHC